MRILITSPVFPPDLGGPAVYVPSIGRYLLDQGHEVKVVAFCSVDQPEGHPFPIVAIPRGPLPIRYLKAFFAVLREAKGQDVVYVQEHLALLHVLAAKLRGVPSVIRIMVDGAWEISHRKGWIDGDDINVFETRDYDWRVKFTRVLQKLWWRWTTRLICCSEFLRGICVQRYGVDGDKAVLIYNAMHGIDAAAIAETQSEARAKLGLEPKRRYLLTICRLMVWKGVDGIIRALERMPADVTLLVAGDGDMQATWEALAVRLGLGDRVQFLGNVPHAKIPLYIRAADVFVLNSEYEGLSHTLIEVTALGTPAVCTGVCGNPEVVEDGINGLLVPQKDDLALREALLRLLGDGAMRERFSAAGIKKSSRFTREATFPKVEQVLLDAASRG